MTDENADALKILSGNLLTSKAEQSAAVITNKEITGVDLSLLKFFIGNHSYNGIILCIDRPSSFYSRLMSENGLKPPAVHFIDVGFQSEPSENVSVISEEPGDLTFIKIEITRVAQRMRMKAPDAKIFFLNDCLLTLLLYNDEKVVGRFLHELYLKLRELNVYSVTVLQPGQPINAIVERMSDRVVKTD